MPGSGTVDSVDAHGEATGSDPFGWLAERAAARRDAGLRRRLTPRGRDDPLLDLASNDYLGLARDERVIAGAIAATRDWGAGSTGSRLVTGSTDLHGELERALAALTGQPRALVFSSGYLANLGAVTALSGPGALLVSDAHNHASIVDAARLSRARVVVVPHLDPSAVSAVLAERSEQRALVVTDAVFSVDGEVAELATLAAVCATSGAALLIDEAHGLGVLGPGGAGAVAAAGLAAQPGVVLTATLSKSLGAQGGAVLGSPDVIDHLVDSARTFIFDTALAPASAGAALAAVQVLRAEPGLPQRVRDAALRLHEAALAAGFGALGPGAAVVGVRVGEPSAAVAAAELMASAGVRVGCFRPPSVPDGVSRLRLTARANLTPADLELAASALLQAAAAPGRQAASSSRR
jgi:8-amino-7-oxononanoate synthase